MRIRQALQKGLYILTNERSLFVDNPSLFFHHDRQVEPLPADISDLYFRLMLKNEIELLMLIPNIEYKTDFRKKYLFIFDFRIMHKILLELLLLANLNEVYLMFGSCQLKIF